MTPRGAVRDPGHYSDIGRTHFQLGIAICQDNVMLPLGDLQAAVQVVRYITAASRVDPPPLSQ